MKYLKTFWNWFTAFFKEEFREEKATVQDVVKPSPVVKEEEDTSSTEYFASLPFEKKIEYARNGVWINKGLGEFFELRFDESLPDDTRKEIARAYAHRSGMPYNDPTIKNRVPVGHGMGDDGNQK